jgi:hypothetical protein
MTTPTDYTILPARHAKGKMKIQCRNDGTGYKNRCHRVAEALARGRYTGRENAYILSPAAAKRFERLYAEGYDASVITYELEAPRKECV